MSRHYYDDSLGRGGAKFGPYRYNEFEDVRFIFSIKTLSLVPLKRKRDPIGRDLERSASWCFRFGTHAFTGPKFGISRISRISRKWAKSGDSALQCGPRAYGVPFPPPPPSAPLAPPLHPPLRRPRSLAGHVALE